MTYISHFLFVTGEVKPKKQHSRKRSRQQNKAPLTRKQRIRQLIKERMLQTKAAVIEVCVVADEPRDILTLYYTDSFALTVPNIEL